jgi:transcriptional regulator with PAS, ATPase and Fis domain
MRDKGKNGLGPVAQACRSKTYSKVILLSSFPPEENSSYVNWLTPQTEAKVSLRQTKLTSPTNYTEIYTAASSVIESTIDKYGKDVNLIFNVSPGTSAMAAVWVLLSTTKYHATLIESSRDHGVKEVDIPFAISVDFLPDLYKQTENNLKRLAAGLPIEAPEFKDIIHRSQIMQQTIHRAQRVAIHALPVLIEGESGTGKELFARAIHKTSGRKGKFISINCGAIPAELVESELFGHEKGSFTGATGKRTGHFEAAHGGTIFLDEIGELPKEIQVKLLRVLQEHEVKPVGATESKSVDLRIIAATNRTLIDEVGEGTFREDLFYRLAVAVIKLPPLRKRTEDISLLTKHFLKQINRDGRKVPGYEKKSIAAEAENILRNHPWPGNVRELQNTLTRAMVWTDGRIIDAEIICEALLPASTQKKDDIMERPLGNGFSIKELKEEICGHYYRRALAETHNNKSQAAKLLGLPNYQTLTSWLKKNKV